MSQNPLLRALAWLGMCLAASSPSNLSGAAERDGVPPEFPVQEISLLEQDLALAAGAHSWAQFAQTLTLSQRQRSEQAGVPILRSASDRLYLVRIGRRVNLPLLSALGLEAIAEIAPLTKLHPLLRAEVPPEFIDKGDGTVWVQLLSYSDVSRMEIEDAVTRHGGRLAPGGARTLRCVVAQLPWLRLRAFAAEDVILWIEPPLVPLTGNNNENRAATGADVAAATYEVDGSGVSALVFDTGAVSPTHPDFAGRIVNNDIVLALPHATHVAGSVGGSGAASNGTNAGMAPGVSIESFALDLTGGGFLLYTDVGDIELDYLRGLERGVDVANASLGSNVAANGLPCSLIGDYGDTASLLDGIARGSLGEPLIMTWSVGNERNLPDCGNLYNTIAPPAAAKNPIMVGATNSNDQSVTFFTSWGPTDDGRMRPDVCAPGCQVGGDGGVTSCALNGQYAVLCGTSMAAPTVAGLIALILESYRIQYPATDDPLNSTMKTILAHTALDLVTLGPDYQTGYGDVQVMDALDHVANGDFFEDRLDQGDSYAFTIEVGAADTELKITLAWDDAPGLPLTVPSLVNNLDLVVTSPSGVRAFPWTLDPGAPANAAVRTQVDALNNIEQVWVANPEVGTWQVAVVGTVVPEGPQDFSICATPSPTVVDFMLSERFPNQIAPEARELVVTIRALGQALVGTPQMHYRFDGGTYTSVPLTLLGDDLYQVSLPAPFCGETPEVYFTAQGSVSGASSDPLAGVAGPYAPAVAFPSKTFSDDFEQNTGWTAGVAGDTATSGLWERVTPRGTSAQPDVDVSPFGTQCYVTGQGPVGGFVGDADVDGGFTTLLSPVIDLGGADAELSYWRWFHNSLSTATPLDDRLIVEISNNGGGSWVEVERVGPTTGQHQGGWFQTRVTVSDFVAPTSTLRVRFIAQDIGNPHIVEAAIDDVQFVQIACPCSTTFFMRADVNDDNSVNITDATSLLIYLFAGGTGPEVLQAADCDGSGSANLTDVIFILDYLFTQGPPPPHPFPEHGCI